MSRPGDRQARVAAGVRGDEALRQALGVWQATVVRQSVLDPVTTEMVRLRCADHHDCHT